MIRRFRIITGLILFAFATGHLTNLALGLNSLETMDAWRGVFMAPWSNSIGGAILMGSLIGHALLSLYSLYRRNTLKMSPSDMVQFSSGLLILPILIPHVISIKMAVDLIPGYEPSYRGLFHYFWIQNPFEGLRQILVLVVLWVHGAIGLLTYFRLQDWWARLGPIINPLIVIVPVSALLGFVEAGNEIIAANPTYVLQSPTGALLETLNTIDTVNWSLIWFYLALVAIVMIARWARLRNQTHQIEVQFVDGPRINTEVGSTLLELAIANDVPHANLCRGRGRCGTCRVLVTATTGSLPPASELELATLKKIGAGPAERLACQLQPDEGALLVERLVPPYIEPKDLKATYRNLRADQPETDENTAEVSA